MLGERIHRAGLRTVVAAAAFRPSSASRATPHSTMIGNSIEIRPPMAFVGTLRRRSTCTDSAARRREKWPQFAIERPSLAGRISARACLYLAHRECGLHASSGCIRQPGGAGEPR